jgi:hypothetical protein
VLTAAPGVCHAPDFVLYFSWSERNLSSFTRTIPKYKSREEVETVLSGRDGFVPLTFRPGRARAGDYIYLLYHGFIAGRARIKRVEAVKDARVESGQVPEWARWLIWYTGGWERPPREIGVQGHQGVRYLEEQEKETLDDETWQVITF